MYPIHIPTPKHTHSTWQPSISTKKSIAAIERTPRHIASASFARSCASLGGGETAWLAWARIGLVVVVAVPQEPRFPRMGRFACPSAAAWQLDEIATASFLMRMVSLGFFCQLGLFRLDMSMSGALVRFIICSMILEHYISMENFQFLWCTY